MQNSVVVSHTVLAWVGGTTNFGGRCGPPLGMGVADGFASLEISPPKFPRNRRTPEICRRPRRRRHTPEIRSHRRLLSSRQSDILNAGCR